MANQPFYHLRPNKFIDRSLFLHTLIGLNSIFPISSYTYTGFGSYLFDDFKLLHNTLNISKMVSLECDPDVYKRACFNVPYNCIRIENKSSTDYISSIILNDKESNIFWLDYVSPGEIGCQLSDYMSLLNLLNPHDIVRITLNANPDALGKSSNPTELQAIRLHKLKQLIPDEYIPYATKEEDVTRNKYPITLLKILKSATLKSLEDRPPYSPNFMLPLFSSVYADGQQMVTFTGIVLDSHEEEESIRNALRRYSYIDLQWTNPCRISIPALTTKELMELNKLLPNTDIQQQLVQAYPFIFSEKESDAVNSYVSFYKFYPNYHHVNF